MYAHIHPNNVIMSCTIVNVSPRIDTNGGVFVHKDAILKIHVENMIDELMCLELSPKARLHDLT
mgnify:FL=1